MYNACIAYVVFYSYIQTCIYIYIKDMCMYIKIYMGMHGDRHIDYVCATCIRIIHM